MAERVVLCMKWGTAFGAYDVNLLYRATADHLTKPARFACITDDPSGLLSEIETFPMQDLPGYRYTGEGRGWPKIDLYLSNLFDLSGRALFLDIDNVVVGDLDQFFEAEGPYLGSDAWYRETKGPTLNTTCFAFDIGGQTQIADAFYSDPQGSIRNFANEQDFACAHALGLNYWPTDWVISFKRHLRRPIGPDLFRSPLAPLPGAKIVAFHGDPRPAALIGRRGLWSKPPHSVRCPVGWLEDYWARYGA